MRSDARMWFDLALSLPKITALKTIRFYQKTLSPDHGMFKVFYPHGFCRFDPSCSQYAYTAVERFGITRGLPMAAYRIFRCNPWNPGGHDPVREKPASTQK